MHVVRTGEIKNAYKILAENLKVGNYLEG